MAAQQTELVDFYVSPYESSSGDIRTWFVYRGNPRSTYVAVCDSREEAMTRAIAMSKSQRYLGKSSVVYARETIGHAWRILPD